MVNKEKYNNVEAKAIINIYKLLEECIEFDNIGDRKLICENINKVKKYKGFVSDKMYSEIDAFIKNNIRPIAYDKNYFDFMIRDEYGQHIAENLFVINSEHSFEMMMLLLYEHTIELSEKLVKFKLQHLCSNVTE